MRQKQLNEQRLAELQLAEQLSVSELSARELHIVRMVAWGLPVKQIADRLDLSLHTVRQHLKNIHRELNVHSPSDLTRWYIFREYGIADNWCKKIIAILLLLISIGSLLEMSCNVRVLRSSQSVYRMARTRYSRRGYAYKLQFS